jgi:hypothetical protein
MPRRQDRGWGWGWRGCSVAGGPGRGVLFVEDEEVGGRHGQYTVGNDRILRQMRVVIEVKVSFCAITADSRCQET